VRRGAQLFFYLGAGGEGEEGEQVAYLALGLQGANRHSECTLIYLMRTASINELYRVLFLRNFGCCFILLGGSASVASLFSA